MWRVWIVASIDFFKLVVESPDILIFWAELLLHLLVSETQVSKLNGGGAQL